MYRGHHRRRRGRGLPPRRGGTQHPRAADPIGRFSRHQKDGYRTACDGLAKLIGSGSIDKIVTRSINILGDFNLAGETWMIRDYYQKMGVEVVATSPATAAWRHPPREARPQRRAMSGSMTHLANTMQERYGIPFNRVSYFGIEDTAQALYDMAEFFADAGDRSQKPGPRARRSLAIMPELPRYRQTRRRTRGRLHGRGVQGIFVVRSLRQLGMETVIVGSQTGLREDYEELRELCDEGTIMVDDSNPSELSRLSRKRGSTCSSAA